MRVVEVVGEWRCHSRCRRGGDTHLLLGRMMFTADVAPVVLLVRLLVAYG